MLKKKRSVSGLITVIQEERFRLHEDGGGPYVLLRLSHRANVDPMELCGFLESNRRVKVEYTGTPNVNTAVATSVKPV